MCREDSLFKPPLAHLKACPTPSLIGLTARQIENNLAITGRLDVVRLYVRIGDRCLTVDGGAQWHAIYRMTSSYCSVLNAARTSAAKSCGCFSR